MTTVTPSKVLVAKRRSTGSYGIFPVAQERLRIGDQRASLPSVFFKDSYLGKSKKLLEENLFIIWSLFISAFVKCALLFFVFLQVLDGAGLDIDFHLASPEGKTLVFEQRKSDGVHTVETEVGDYMFCFDNTFSTISEKVIFFELILDNMGEQEQEQEDWKKYITGTDMLDMKLEDILESIYRIKSRLSKSGHIQTLLRAFEARDRNIQESNFDRVNFWSMVNLVVMVVVSAIQVYMLKSLFEDKRKSRT
nr:transmembrane emp24 domain-containing protein 5 [Odocoileus virginianus texanus]